MANEEAIRAVKFLVHPHLICVRCIAGLPFHPPRPRRSRSCAAGTDRVAPWGLSRPRCRSAKPHGLPNRGGGRHFSGFVSYPGTVTIARAAGTFTYPARFQLVASMNPCPCGYRGTRSVECRCDDAMVAKYVSKLSGPLLDRIDLQIEIARVPFDDMVRYDGAERSATIRQRVVAARERQCARFAEMTFSCNAEIPGNAMRRYCALDEPAMRILALASAKRQFSARALDRIARVARTIADLIGAEEIRAEHVAEAIRYRSLERLGAAA